MSQETLECIVRKAFDYAEGMCSFAFQGGEPTLIGLDFFKLLLELEKKYNQKEIQVSNIIQTNGYDCNEEWAAFFAENHFLVGISLDGVKHCHDSYRKNPKGEGSFGDIMKTIELLKKNKVEFNVLTVVTNKVAQKAARVYEFYKKNGIEFQQYIPCLDPLMEAPGEQEYSLSPKAYGNFLIELFELWYLDLQQGKQPYIRNFENYIGILAGFPAEACDQRGVCSIQNVIEADGSVYPCDFYVLDEYKLGNVRDSSFTELRNNSVGDEFLQASVPVPEKCKQCRYGKLCRNGCRRNRMTDENINYYCEAYQIFFDAVYGKMQKIAAGIRR